jgi:ABC-type dipeptide/oligopeptide/nickel transport system permease subunit
MAIASAAIAVRTGSRRRRGSLRRIATSTCMIVILLLYAAALIHPGLFAHASPTDGGMDILTGPGGKHIFGTDQLGRDTYSRVIYGAQPVLFGSLGGVLLATLAGVAIGIVGGIAPRWIQAIVMRVVDVLLALPVLLVALILISVVGTGVNSIIIALGVAYAPGMARIVEASVRKLRTVEYVQAARMFGSSGVRVAIRHLVPNLITEVVVMASSALGWAVLTATTLSFLGLGVQLPDADWGSDLAAGASSLSTAWWVSTFPGIAITVTIFVANFAGDWVMGLLDRGRGRSYPRFRAIRGLWTAGAPAEAAVAEAAVLATVSEED